MRLIITELPSQTVGKLGYRAGGCSANNREVIRVTLSDNWAVSLQRFVSYTGHNRMPVTLVKFVETVLNYNLNKQCKNRVYKVGYPKRGIVNKGTESVM